MYCKKCRRVISDRTWNLHEQICYPQIKEQPQDDFEDVDLQTVNYKELKEIAKKKGLDFKNNIKKTELIKIIEENL